MFIGKVGFNNNKNIKKQIIMLNNELFERYKEQIWIVTKLLNNIKNTIKK